MINNKNIASASHKKTNDKAFEVISFLANKKTKILDLGAGKGHLSRRVYNFLSENNLNPRKQLIASDFSAPSFKAREVTFKQADFNKKLPFKNKSFDIVYSIEVIEHLRSPYDFLGECFRILKPNGTLIISTPNTFNLYSRFKFLITGFFDLYKPPSIKPENAGRLCGHIMPLHRGAAAKTLLANLPARKQQQYFAALEPQLLPEELFRLESQLGVIGQTNFAESESEVDSGVWAVAAPVIVSSRVIGAVSIVAPAFRIPEETRARFRTIVKDASTEIANGILNESLNHSNS